MSIKFYTSSNRKKFPTVPCYYKYNQKHLEVCWLFKQIACVVFIDHEKAFDTVAHTMLLNKLSQA